MHKNRVGLSIRHYSWGSHQRNCQQCYQEGYSRGYEQGKKDCQIWYFCDQCGDRIDVSPDSNSHKALIGLYEGAWLGT